MIQSVLSRHFLPCIGVMRSIFNPRFDRTIRHKEQTLERKVLDFSMCYFLGLSIQVIIDLCSQFSYFVVIFFFFFFFFFAK